MLGTLIAKPIKDYDTYTALAEWANANNAVIVDKGEYYKCEAVPEPTEAELAEQARKKRDELIEEVYWRCQRYDTQEKAGVATTDSPETMQKIYTYIQALRDVPEQEGFPKTIVWPELGE